MNIYYKIWIDCILCLRSQKQNKDTWMEKSMFSMTIAMTVNLLFFMAILQRNILGCYFYEFNISSPNVVSDVERANGILNILVLFVLPCFVVNFLLIFRSKKRLKRLIRKYKYPYYNGKLFIAYFLISLFFPLTLAIIGIIIYQDVTFWDFFITKH
jgi:archaellum biogenesis protein FlaJ (TadC family)